MKLCEVAEIVMGQSPPSASYNDIGIGLPFFQGKTDFGLIYPLPKKFCTDPKKMAMPNDVLISVRAPVGPVNLCVEKSCIGRGLAAIRPKNIDSKFLFLYLIFAEEDVANLGTGSTFKAINKKQLYDFKIFCPQLPEQRKIAHILSRILDAIEKQEQTINTTTELKKTLMQKLFTEGLHGEPQKETEIGLIPESWEVVLFDSIVNFKTGKLNSNAAKLDGKYPFFTCSQETYWIDEYAFDQEAILLSGNNARAIYSVKHYKGKFNAYQRTYVLTIKEDAEYSYSYLKYSLSLQLEFLRTISIGTSTKYLTLGLLKNLRLPKPPLNIQKEIAAILNAIDSKIENHISNKEILIALFQSLLHQLMTGQISVNNIEFPNMWVD